jgi:FixJ family two-component response regulator
MNTSVAHSRSKTNALVIDAAWVFVVDDEPSIRRALARLFRSAGLQAQTFSSAQEFLQYDLPDTPSCLVLDLQMPEVDGLQLQQSLRDGHVALPIIFITGHGDIPQSVRAIKAGALDFLTKPFEDEELLRAVRQALDQDKIARELRSDDSTIQERVTKLSTRERQVLACVVAGMPNKQTARRLGIKEKTVKAHRGQVMQKMQAGSLAELVRMADKAGIEAP